MNAIARPTAKPTDTQAGWRLDRMYLVVGT